MSSLTDLKFLTPEEQDQTFSKIHRELGRLVLQGRISREGHRICLTMLTELEKIWFFNQTNFAGTARTEDRPLP